jgi:hypothetical protein
VAGKEILSIPDLPKEIIKAINNNRLVVFIGAGASRLVGCIGWDELAKNLVMRCYETKKRDGKRCIGFKEKGMLLREQDHKKIITICHGILKENGFEKKFLTEFRKALKGKKKLLNNNNIYDQLASIKAVFITTNADIHFDETKYFREERILHKKEDFELLSIEPRKLYHIHGRQEDPDSLVFTVDKYIERYNEDYFQLFLREIFFGRYVVLFVGYGMSEFELIDYLVQKSNPRSKTRGSNFERRHFILLPYFEDEANIRDFHRHYYQRLGIEVLAYSKNDGYEQLYNVIKDWNKKIRQITDVISDDFQEIEDIVDSL